jgi:hypothetical protein
MGNQDFSTTAGDLLQHEMLEALRHREGAFGQYKHCLTVAARFRLRLPGLIQCVAPVAGMVQVRSTCASV